MYEIDHRHMPGTIGIRITGDIQEPNFVALREEMATILDKTAPLNVVFICDPDVEIQPAVLWDDMKFMESRAEQLGRMALVAADAWLPMVEVVREAGFNSRYFPHAEIDAAWQWAAGD